MHQHFTPERAATSSASLTMAEGIERYLHTRYVGAEALLARGRRQPDPDARRPHPAGRRTGVEEIVIGMAHRGRINVLVNVLGKAPEELFCGVRGQVRPRRAERVRATSSTTRAFRADMRTPGGNVHVALAFNPSHLEIVNPVVEGSVRARQERRGDDARRQGDAGADSWRRRVRRRRASSRRRCRCRRRAGSTTGGTIHIIVNNQVGFTISDPRDARSTTYCSDVAKMIEAPIFHVNGDDPEAVVFVTRLRARLPAEVPQGRRDRPGLLPAPSATTRPTSPRPPSR